VSPLSVRSGNLDGISCVSAVSCEAVGIYAKTSTSTSAQAEVWDGNAWNLQAVPAPTGSTYSSLYSVSCVSPNFCEAVGYYVSASAGFAQAEVWNGKFWKLQPVPAPTASTYNLLSAVSCVSDLSCEAVGTYYNSAGHPAALAEVWNGTTWKVQPTPNLTTRPNISLNAVSCTSANACEAVGDYSPATDIYLALAEEWNGKVWKLQPVPEPTGTVLSQFVSVSCSPASVSANSCEAVGWDAVAPTEVPLAEVWNGTAWKAQSTPAAAAPLYGVSCLSASSCTAVGHVFGSTGTPASAEAWNGTAWTVQSVPPPTGATSDQLLAVSCVSAGSCEAVGDFTNAAGSVRTLAEVQSGTSWNHQPAP
jgi:hypothetical protein